MQLNLLRTVRRKSPLYGEKGFIRIANDSYSTEEWVTRALLDFLPFSETIWEPACGDGAMSEIIKQYYNRIIYSDIQNNINYRAPCLDFLKIQYISPDVRSIITNPPYTRAEEFINKALELMKSRRATIAMLLRNEYDSAASRRYLFEQRPFYAKLVLTKRPMWIADSTGSPRHNFSWFVWKMDYIGYPIIGYLPKQST